MSSCWLRFLFFSRVLRRSSCEFISGAGVQFFLSSDCICGVISN